MFNIHAGQLVWVRTGSGTHEESATVLNVLSDTKNGEPEIVCKFHVSMFENTVPMSHIRIMSTEGRPKRNRSLTVVSPSPIPLSKKAKDNFALSNTSMKNLLKPNINVMEATHEDSNMPIHCFSKLMKSDKLISTSHGKKGKASLNKNQSKADIIEDSDYSVHDIGYGRNACESIIDLQGALLDKILFSEL
jgi:hypothetical protein